MHWAVLCLCSDVSEWCVGAVSLDATCAARAQSRFPVDPTDRAHTRAADQHAHTRRTGSDACTYCDSAPLLVTRRACLPVCVITSLASIHPPILLRSSAAGHGATTNQSERDQRRHHHE